MQGVKEEGYEEEPEQEGKDVHPWGAIDRLVRFQARFLSATPFPPVVLGATSWPERKKRNSQLTGSCFDGSSYAKEGAIIFL